MIEQLDHPQRRPSDTDGAARAPAPVLSVFGHPGRLAGLSAQLPAGWVLRRPRDLDDVGADDIVLFNPATAAAIAAARAELPRRTRLVAVVDEEAPARIVAAVLTAGADVCVRGGPPAVLAGHLLGCRRRQAAERFGGQGH